MKNEDTPYRLFLVKDIKLSINNFKNLGYKEESNIIVDEIRSIFITFLKNENSLVELIQPSKDNKKFNSILRKGGGLYHICYITSNIGKDLKSLLEQKYVLIEDINIAPAINNSLVAFLYNECMGIIELVELKN